MLRSRACFGIAQSGSVRMYLCRSDWMWLYIRYEYARSPSLWGSPQDPSDKVHTRSHICRGFPAGNQVLPGWIKKMPHNLTATCNYFTRRLIWWICTISCLSWLGEGLHILFSNKCTLLYEFISISNLMKWLWIPVRSDWSHVRFTKAPNPKQLAVHLKHKICIVNTMPS